MLLPPAVEERLARLAPDQRAAGTAPPGPVLCVAPAGSGKTTTLVARVAWLVATGTPPERICAVTFNKRAADELGGRVAAALAPLGHPPEAVRVRTFHALGREILADAGQPVEPLVDRSTLLQELEGPLSPADLQRLDDGFSRLKLDLAVDTARMAEEVEAAAARGTPAGPAARAFLRYEAALRERGALDFDDLVRGALAVLQARPSLLARWRDQCAQLLVDEVQDVDRSQLRLALLLAAPANRIFLVGDDDQTIYAWRLANVRRVLNLAAALPGLQRRDLITNYRCPPAVVARAVRLVEHNRERFSKTIRAGTANHGRLHLLPDPGDDVARARRLLREWRPPDGEARAILARTNADLAPYAAVALEYGIPYRAADDGLLLDHLAIDKLVEAASTPSPAALLERLVALRASAAPGQDTAASALLAWAPGRGTAAQLAAAVADARARRAALRRDDAPLLLATAHATKGLEFDHVAVVGFDEDRFPSARSLTEAEDPERALEEERRLAYVAWTRARRSLVLIYDPDAPSPFLREAFSMAELRPG